MRIWRKWNVRTYTPTALHTTVTYLPTPGSLVLLYDIVTVMDARKMEFIPDQCFDLIIDKGTSTTTLTTLKYFPPSDTATAAFCMCIYLCCTALFDAVLCSENNLKDIQALLREMHRVLKMGGVYLLVSHGPPDNRVSHIKRYIDVDIDVVPIRT